MLKPVAGDRGPALAAGDRGNGVPGPSPRPTRRQDRRPNPGPSPAGRKVVLQRPARKDFTKRSQDDSMSHYINTLRDILSVGRPLSNAESAASRHPSPLVENRQLPPLLKRAPVPAARLSPRAFAASLTRHPDPAQTIFTKRTQDEGIQWRINTLERNSAGRSGPIGVGSGMLGAPRHKARREPGTDPRMDRVELKFRFRI